MTTITGDFFNQKSYILEIDKKIIVIDPGYNYEKIKKELNNKKLDMILLTHFHFDHVACVDKLCDDFNIKAYIHQNDLEHLISDNGAEAMGLKKVCVKKVNIKTFKNKIKELPSLEIIEASGHTLGSVLFKFNNKVFTGDVLFANGNIGRTDLPGADPLFKKENIKNIFLNINHNFIIFPGHGKSAKLNEIMMLLDN